MEIKILGSGCHKCHSLEGAVREALNETGISADVGKVTDLKEIVGYGVLLTPGLVIDGEVKSSGKVLSKQEIIKLLQ